MTKDNSTESIYFLTSASYLEGKGEVVIEFSSESEKITLPFPFVPSAIINTNGFPVQNFCSLAKEVCSEKFALVECGRGSARITARSFSLLGGILLSLRSAFNISYLLLAPERQFLLSRGWSYFDAFSFFGNCPVKQSFIGIPEAKLGGFERRVRDIAGELLAHNFESGNVFLERLALSKILCLKPEFVPKAYCGQSDAFLEIILFRNSFAPKTGGLNSAGYSGKAARGFFGAKALDFSPVWLGFFSSENRVPSPDAINCGCCKPEGLSSIIEPRGEDSAGCRLAFQQEDGNILPNSVVDAEFLVDAAYFESLSEKWAKRFHDCNPFRRERLLRKDEFCLSTIPSGPFFRGNIVSLLLADARRLEEQGIARISGLKEPLWFCIRKEGFFSAEVAAAGSLLGEVREKMVSMEKKALSRGIVDYTAACGSMEYIYLSSFHSAVERLISSLPPLIAGGKKYSFPVLSEVLLMRQNEAMQSFREFCGVRGARIVFKGNNSAYSKANSVIALSREFSKANCTREPKARLPRIAQ